MIQPVHEFLLLIENEELNTEYMKRFLERKEEAIQIPDNIIRYIDDTLQWIPSYNPANPNNWIGFGLNPYGPTIINKSGADMFQNICEIWALMFTKGPKCISLTGDWIAEVDKIGQEGEGHYQKIELDRDELVEKFNLLASYAKQVSTEQFVILHMGL